MSSDEESGNDDPTPYVVGKGKPPLHTRWKKGASPNPSGRPKGARNASTIWEQGFEEKVSVVDNGRTVKKTKSELLITQTINDGIRKDGRSRQEALSRVEAIEAKKKPEGVFGLSEKEMDAAFEDYVRRTRK